ncbi:MAG: tetratricopeptide repeat protein [Candidatus Sabulitectum sp.]|nr:tetratricopeptide repeat protein [Candidatus Sabulitectum sp.]
MTANKKDLLKLHVSSLNILLIILSCTVLFSCTGDQEALPDPSALFSAAGEAYSNGDLVCCRDLLVRVTVLDPENPNVWRNLGTVNLDLGLYDDAITAYRQVIEIDSARVDVLTDITGALLGAGRLSEALHTGQLSIQLTPDDGIAFNNYGMALMESGCFEDAAMCFNTALRREPQNASVLYNCGRITLMAGDPEEALMFFQSSIAADPGFMQPQIETARTLGILGRHTEAEERILSVLAAVPSDPEALNILALSYSSQGRQEEAVSVLEALLNNNPGDLPSRLGLAECLYLYGDLPEALENYQLFMEGVLDTAGTSDIRFRIQELEAILD